METCGTGERIERLLGISSLPPSFLPPVCVGSPPEQALSLSLSHTYISSLLSVHTHTHDSTHCTVPGLRFVVKTVVCSVFRPIH